MARWHEICSMEDLGSGYPPPLPRSLRISSLRAKRIFIYWNHWFAGKILRNNELQGDSLPGLTVGVHFFSGASVSCVRRGYRWSIAT